MNGNPDISIIVPVYNMGKYLTRCTDSILKQTHEDFELILVDDGSTDDCPNICDQLAAKHQKIRVMHTKNEGVASARNKGADISTGTYIMFVDADDYILPGMLEKMFAVAEINQTDLLCCGVKKDMGDGRTIDKMEYYIKFTDIIYDIVTDKQRDFMYNFATGGRNGTIGGKLYNREFIRNNNLHFEKNIHSEDMVYNLSVCMSAKKVGAISDTYYIYYDRSGSRMYTSDVEKIRKSADRLWDLYLTYTGASIDEVRAFGLVRIISSMIFNLKNNGLDIEQICRAVEQFITDKRLRYYLSVAAEDDIFHKYTEAVKIDPINAANFHLFIKSLGSFREILAWQKHYAELEVNR